MPCTGAESGRLIFGAHPGAVDQPVFDHFPALRAIIAKVGDVAGPRVAVRLVEENSGHGMRPRAFTADSADISAMTSGEYICGLSFVFYAQRSAVKSRPVGGFALQSHQKR